MLHQETKPIPDAKSEFQLEIETFSAGYAPKAKDSSRKFSQSDRHRDAKVDYTSRYLMIEQRAFLDGSIHGPICEEQLERLYATFLEQGRDDHHILMSDQEYAERKTWEHCCR